MNLRLVSETETTITLGWDPVQGAVGYRFTAEKQAKPSHTWDPARTTVKFAKGSSWYKVEALATTQTGLYPPPAPPPTPQAIFDGRAARMNTLTGSTVTGNNDAYQDPEVWGKTDGDRSDGLYFMGDDIRLVSDNTFNQVYLIETNGFSQNPYWVDDCCCSAEMTYDHPIGLGEAFWYTNAIKIDPGNVLTSWQTLHQSCYNGGVSSPPLGIYMRSDGWGYERHCGVVPAPFEQAEIFHSGTLHPWDSIKGKWIEYIMGWVPTQTATGWIRIYTRVKANGETGFTLRYSVDNEITYQWLQGQTPKTSGEDKIGHYWEYTGAKSTWPTNRVWQRGLMRFADEASARASFA